MVVGKQQVRHGTYAHQDFEASTPIFDLPVLEELAGSNVRNTGGVKLLVIGPSCAGKTTVSRYLRSASVATIDLDDELVRLNGGVYPDIETRKTVIAPLALANAAAMTDVILLHSTLDASDVRALKGAGFVTALLEVSPSELRRRHKVRLKEEGWTNEAWFEDNQALIADLLQQCLFDYVIDAERDPAIVAADLIRLITG